MAPAPLNEGEEIKEWCDGDIDWHFHLRKVCEEFDTRFVIILFCENYIN